MNPLWLFFLVLPGLVAFAIVLALRGPRRGAAGLPLVVLLGWFALIFGLSSSGVLAQFERLPPRIPLLVMLAIGGGVGLARTAPLREVLRAMPAWWPVALQTFRAPLEVGLYLLFTAGLLPEQMTFSGRNFDVLVGVTAPMMAFLIATGRASRGLQLAWQLAAVGLLVNVVGIAITSAPGPLHAAWPGAPLTVVAQWPYVLLPTFLVPIAALGHVAAISRLLRRS